MKHAFIVIRDDETGEEREFAIPQSQGIVTFFGTVVVGADVRSNSPYSDIVWLVNRDAICAMAAEEYLFSR